MEEGHSPAQDGAPTGGRVSPVIWRREHVSRVQGVGAGAWHDCPRAVLPERLLNERTTNERMHDLPLLYPRG